MKKVFTILALAGVALTASAQKGNISKAENALILQKVDDAKTLIDEAVVNEKSKDLPKTFIVAANVYAKLAEKKVDSEAFAKVSEYMAKAEELDAKGDAKGKGIGKSQKDIKKMYSALLMTVQNVGAQAYEAKNWNLMRDAFLYAAECNKNSKENYTAADDSLLVYNAGLGAWYGEDYKSAAQCFEKNFEMDYEGVKTIGFAYNAYKNLGDTLNMERIIKKGFEKYPTEKGILGDLINFYLGAKRNDDALTYLNEAISKYDKVPDYYYARGCLYEKIDEEKAIADYQKALELNPEHFNALYNVAIMYYNKGINLRNDASNERDDKKYAVIMKNVQETTSKAVPFIERAVEAAPSTEMKIEALSTMKAICYGADPEDNSGKMMKAINALKELQQ
ncbi:MAG: tetratricopeptide repeat protein [Bacteroidales bacterium]|nr:tetratricopeptide repeat protein [Bacteroidales bacterium]